MIMDRQDSALAAHESAQLDMAYAHHRHVSGGIGGELDHYREQREFYENFVGPEISDNYRWQREVSLKGPHKWSFLARFLPFTLRPYWDAELFELYLEELNGDEEPMVPLYEDIWLIESIEGRLKALGPAMAHNAALKLISKDELKEGGWLRYGETTGNHIGDWAWMPFAEELGWLSDAYTISNNHTSRDWKPLMYAQTYMCELGMSPEEFIETKITTEMLENSHPLLHKVAMSNLPNWKVVKNAAQRIAEGTRVNPMILTLNYD